MNQINLDTLLQLPTAARPDNAPIKLVVAEFYQGQLQQLGAQSFRLQLPSAQGPLQLALPQQASYALQQMMPASAVITNQAPQTANTSTQTSRILNTAINQFTGATLAALTTAQISSLPLSQLKQLSAQQLAALKPEQVAAFNTAQLQQLAPQQLQNLTSTQLSALSPLQLQALAPQVLQSLTGSQLKQLSPAQLLAVQNAIPAAAAVKQAVTVQFEPQANGNIGLKIQPAQQAPQFSLSPAVLRQILIGAYSSEIPSTPVLQPHNQSALLLSATLQLSADTKFIRLPELPALPLSKTAVTHLTQWLKHSTTSQLTVLLQLQSQSGKLVANLQLPSQENTQPPLSLLEKPQQLQLTQQLVKWFNQAGFRSQSGPAPIAANTALAFAATTPKPINLQLHGVDSTVNLQFRAANSPLQQTVALPASHPHQLTLMAIASTDKAPLNLTTTMPLLQIKDDQSALQLQPNTPRLQLSLAPQAANRELQFLPANSQVQTTTKVQPAPDSSNIQNAWRHLLPLLPTKLDPLQTQPQLPPAVQQVLTQLRLSQPGAQRTLTSTQLMQQLQSVLQFQPLQTQPNIQTAGGSLAVAIQLLLGQLVQKPAPAALQPANQKLAQLVSNLEPAQAGSLLRQLSGYSSVMQQSQLATLDSSSPTTPQQLILQLPLQQNNQSVLSQIQLEQREGGQDANGKKHTLWQLTMRFDLEQLGPLLVVAKLQHEQLHLQLYTEQQQAKQQADKFLPLLQERCTMQGLTVTNAECTLGKIPDSLLPRANSLLAIKV